MWATDKADVNTFCIGLIFAHISTHHINSTTEKEQKVNSFIYNLVFQ